MDVNRFKELPILGILRGITSESVKPLTETAVSSGLKAIEITMNTPDAAGLISQMVRAADGRIAVGAGTVLSLKDLHSALDAGATFIVMPTLISDVMEYCVKNSIPVFPGALTPQEIYNAWNAGATMVKVFPAKFFGPSYMKEIKGPFQDIKLLACGGISAETIGQFFSSGADAVAFGGGIFKKEWIDAGKFALIEEAITKLISGFRITHGVPD
ncbi:MAG: bifunctional 4-hydroxy-2-oxoglutarate aldolase/2-dehydro-3-deoxy-phosphogluconate aldolase [Nitrospirae bacterium]|nr:bifunctional 4-hydroxy-2-oxoglutarate aldolase/2-dehydro-3-deoxy-phosphogluconate aldolase [Nitrospirota bacterium]